MFEKRVNGSNLSVCKLLTSTVSISYMPNVDWLWFGHRSEGKIFSLVWFVKPLWTPPPRSTHGYSLHVWEGEKYFEGYGTLFPIGYYFWPEGIRCHLGRTTSQLTDPSWSHHHGGYRSGISLPHSCPHLNHQRPKHQPDSIPAVGRRLICMTELHPSYGWLVCPANASIALTL